MVINDRNKQLLDAVKFVVLFVMVFIYTMLDPHKPIAYASPQDITFEVLNSRHKVIHPTNAIRNAYIRLLREGY